MENIFVFISLLLFKIFLCNARSSLNPEGLPQTHIAAGDGIKELPCNTWASIDPGASVRVKSQNYPNNYPNSEYCLRTLVATTRDSKLHFSCKEFSLASNPISPCRTADDHLKIWESNPRKSKSYCGSVAPNLIKTAGAVLNIGFYTNWRNSDRGFNCIVTVVNRKTGPDRAALRRRPSTGRPRVIPSFSASTCSCGVGTAPLSWPSVLQPSPSSSETPDAWVGLHEHPWLGLIRIASSTNDLCGATLINHKFLLTSATCVYGTSEDLLEVVLGEHSPLLRSETNQTRTYMVEDVTIHPEYNRTSFMNDIALIELIFPVDEDASYLGIKPVCLPTEPTATNEEESKALIIGWQSFPWGPGMRETPEKSVVTLSYQPECNKSFDTFDVSRSMICAKNSQVGTCRSDVGGPLLVKERGRYTLIGISSVVQDCRDPETPAVFTKVADYMTWIKSNTRNVRSCFS